MKVSMMNTNDIDQVNLKKAYQYLEDAKFLFGMRENVLYIEKMKAIEEVLTKLEVQANG